MPNRPVLLGLGQALKNLAFAIIYIIYRPAIEEVLTKQTVDPPPRQTEEFYFTIIGEIHCRSLRTCSMAP